MRIAVAGNDDFVTGFRLAGLKKAFVAEGKELNKTINEIIESKNYGILIMDEDEFNDLTHMTKKKLSKTVTPVTVTLSSSGKGSNLREMVKRSVGVDLWKD